MPSGRLAISEFEPSSAELHAMVRDPSFDFRTAHGLDSFYQTIPETAFELYRDKTRSRCIGLVWKDTGGLRGKLFQPYLVTMKGKVKETDLDSKIVEACALALKENWTRRTRTEEDPLPKMTDYFKLLLGEKHVNRCRQDMDFVSLTQFKQDVEMHFDRKLAELDKVLKDIEEQKERLLKRGVHLSKAVAAVKMAKRTADPTTQNIITILEDLLLRWDQRSNIYDDDY